MSKFWGILVVGMVVLSATSCAKNTEQDDLASAQKCLDNVPEGQPAAADACLPLVKDYTSQQANILRCAIIMTSGGLMENKIVAAYNALKDTTQSSEAASFMAALGLDYSDVNVGYTKAVQANEYCQETGVPGLMYISGVIVAGSYMDMTMAALGLGAINVNDPTSINTAVTTFLNTCGASGAPNPSCTANLPTLGATVTNLSNSYCATSGADTTVCGQISSAVNSAGGSPSNVGQALLCYMNNKTYNSTTNQCQ